MKAYPTHTIPYTLDAGELGEFDLTLHFTYTPGSPDVMYMPNGDPGYPGDPAEYEIIKVEYQKFDVTNWFDVAETFNSSERVCEAIAEWAMEADKDAAESYYQDMKEQREYDRASEIHPLHKQ